MSPSTWHRNTREKHLSNQVLIHSRVPLLKLNYPNYKLKLHLNWGYLGTISLTNHDFQWGCSKVVIMNPKRTKSDVPIHEYPCILRATNLRYPALRPCGEGGGVAPAPAAARWPHRRLGGNAAEFHDVCRLKTSTDYSLYIPAANRWRKIDNHHLVSWEHDGHFQSQTVTSYQRVFEGIINNPWN